jgi:hypothetical protein
MSIRRVIGSWAMKSGGQKDGKGKEVGIGFIFKKDS